MEWNGSAGIQSVVDDKVWGSNDIFSKVTCNMCEMAVVWMQHQLAQNQTQEFVLQYINQVYLLSSNTMQE